MIPIFLVVLNFRPHEAVPLSNATIFGGALVHFPLNMIKRHSLAPDRPVVNWDLVLAMEPATIFGAILGTYLNQCARTSVGGPGAAYTQQACRHVCMQEPGCMQLII